MRLHDIALEIGLQAGHSTYDTLYVTFALAAGASNLVVADRRFLAAMRRHPTAELSGMLITLPDWAEMRRDDGAVGGD